MTGPDKTVLEATAARLAQCATELSAAGLEGTANIVRVARLDLLTHTHNVADEEFQALLALAEGGRRGAPKPAPVPHREESQAAAARKPSRSSRPIGAARSTKINP